MFQYEPFIERFNNGFKFKSEMQIFMWHLRYLGKTIVEMFPRCRSCFFSPIEEESRKDAKFSLILTGLRLSKILDTFCFGIKRSNCLALVWPNHDALLRFGEMKSLHWCYQFMLFINTLIKIWLGKKNKHC